MASGTTHDDDRVEEGSGAEGSAAEQRSLEASGTPVPKRKKGHKAKHHFHHH